MTESIQRIKGLPQRKISGLPARLPLDEARACVDWILSNIAERPRVGRGNRQQVPISGKNVSWQGKNLRFRGSDFAERAAISVSILIHADSGQHDACVDVASNPRVESRLARSKRGRPRGQSFEPCELDDKAETVRGLYRKFWRVKEGALPRDQIVQLYFWGWWHQDYNRTHPHETFKERNGTWKERIAASQTRRHAAIKAMSS